MSITLRILLIIASIFSFILCLKRIKQSKLKITNSVVWMLGSVALVLMAIFSNAVEWVALKLGFVAPVNFVFLVMIAFLLMQTFIDNIRISALNEKVKELNHYIALKELQAKNDIEK
ncbi:MAG: DUF2304 domain-containing protein [Clostridia bacterium]|nr:DUF2304 domain-containing protein [Clostridia bacterium]